MNELSSLSVLGLKTGDSQATVNLTRFIWYAIGSIIGHERVGLPGFADVVGQRRFAGLG